LKEIETKVRENLRLPGTEQEPRPESEEPEQDTPDPNTETDVDVSNNNNEQMITDMKDNILRKWEVLKEEDMAEPFISDLYYLK